jgi:hypothetical protein
MIAEIATSVASSDRLATGAANFAESTMKVCN